MKERMKERQKKHKSMKESVFRIWNWEVVLLISYAKTQPIITEVIYIWKISIFNGKHQREGGKLS